MEEKGSQRATFLFYFYTNIYAPDAPKKKEFVNRCDTLNI